MTAKRPQKAPELKVVLDTSAIFTGSASDLLRSEVVETIRTTNGFPDLKVSWHVPQIVIHERQYQMLKRAMELLPAIDKLERLLGHNLNITAMIIEKRVAEAIEAQVAALGISVRVLDSGQVDWPAVMRAAAFRMPPFEAGEKEKGFRDALVAETFLQVVRSSPVTPKVCRVALVTGDTLLAETVKERTASAANVRVLLNREELSGLINTLVADVSEEFVARLVPKAQRCFFVPKDESTLYYTQKLGSKLGDTFQTQLSALPSGATQRRNGTWFIAPPRFVRKEGQRVFWATRVTVEATAFAYAQPSSPLLVSPGEEINLSKLTEPVKMDPKLITFGQTGLLGIGGQSASWRALPAFSLFGEEKEVAKGRTVLEVNWSTAVRTSGALGSPQVGELKFIETTWD